MNKLAIQAYAGTIVRYGIVWAVAKFGLGSFIGDADVEKIVDVVMLLAVTAYGVWSKRKALATPPVKAGLMIALLLVPAVMLMTGCAVVSGKAGESHYVGFACGEKASSTLAGLNVTETKTEKGTVVTDRGVGIDQAGSSGQADMGKILGNLLLLGLQSQGIPAKSAALNGTDTTDQTDSGDAVETSPATDPSTETASVSFDATGYNGSPGPSGEGVYGKPSCGRCRAYHAAHPDKEIVNTEVQSNRDAMWKALRRLGFTGDKIDLPVIISSSAYDQMAK